MPTPDPLLHEAPNRVVWAAWFVDDMLSDYWSWPEQGVPP